MEADPLTPTHFNCSISYCKHSTFIVTRAKKRGTVTRKLLNAGSYLLIGALAGVTFALWLTKSEVDDARDQLRTIYAQTLDQTNGACKQASQQ